MNTLIQRLQALADARAKATQGEWSNDIREYDVRVRNGRYVAYFGPHHTPESEYPPACKREDEANAAFAATAANAPFPAMLAEATALQARVAKLEAALAYMADEANWESYDSTGDERPLLKRPGGGRKEGVILIGPHERPWVFARKALETQS